MSCRRSPTRAPKPTSDGPGARARYAGRTKNSLMGWEPSASGEGGADGNFQPSTLASRAPATQFANRRFANRQMVPSKVIYLTLALAHLGIVSDLFLFEIAM
jgi:hypothetical protein